MHPTLQHQLMNAQIADLHHQAQRDRTARAAIRSRRTQTHPRARFLLGRAVTVMARMLTLAGGPSPTR